jgi:hypothetical protein
MPRIQAQHVEGKPLLSASRTKAFASGPEMNALLRSTGLLPAASRTSTGMDVVKPTAPTVRILLSVSAGPGSYFFRKGETRSRGIGKIVFVDFSDEISVSV